MGISGLLRNQRRGHSGGRALQLLRVADDGRREGESCSRMTIKDSINRSRDRGNILWALPYTTPIMFLGIFGRARIAGQSVWSAVAYGLAGIGVVSIGFAVVEVLRRIFERR